MSINLECKINYNKSCNIIDLLHNLLPINNSSYCLIRHDHYECRINMIKTFDELCNEIWNDIDMFKNNCGYCIAITENFESYSDDKILVRFENHDYNEYQYHIINLTKEEFNILHDKLNNWKQ